MAPKRISRVFNPATDRFFGLPKKKYSETFVVANWLDCQVASTDVISNYQKDVPIDLPGAYGPNGAGLKLYPTLQFSLKGEQTLFDELIEWNAPYEAPVLIKNPDYTAGDGWPAKHGKFNYTLVRNGGHPEYGFDPVKLNTGEGDDMCLMIVTNSPYILII